MDAGLVIRPSAAGSRPSVARSGSGSLRGAVRPDLGAAQSVTAASNPDNVHHDPAQGQHNPPDPHGGNIILDAQSREVVFRTADVRARGLVRQVPETAARRLKAYARTANENTEQTGTLADTEL
jgi:hypothetical protein